MHTCRIAIRYAGIHTKPILKLFEIILCFSGNSNQTYFYLVVFIYAG